MNSIIWIQLMKSIKWIQSNDVYQMKSKSIEFKCHKLNQRNSVIYINWINQMYSIKMGSINWNQSNRINQNNKIKWRQSNESRQGEVLRLLVNGTAKPQEDVLENYGMFIYFLQFSSNFQAQLYMLERRMDFSDFL